MIEKKHAARARGFSVLRGMSSISLFPHKDYSRHISSTSELMKRSWERTGLVLKQAMDKVGGDGVAKKDGAESIA